MTKLQTMEDEARNMAAAGLLVKAGQLSRAEGRAATAYIRAIEQNMNHTFWDVPRPAGGFKSCAAEA